ncbi:DUF7673 family protein [Eoetvoesiella caeni]
MIDRNLDRTLALAQLRAERELADVELPGIREAGEIALRRLLPLAQRDTGQSGVIARFLLGLYNGPRFPFNLTDLRRLDRALLIDCLAVLRMDSTPEREIHEYFENGSKLFEQMATDWNADKSSSDH